MTTGKPRLESDCACWLHVSHHRAMRQTAAVLGVLVLFELLVSLLPISHEVLSPANYLPLHTLLESGAVAIAVLVFAIGWNAHGGRLASNIVVLASALLGVALLDFSHTLSYRGMPEYVTPSSPDKAIFFWLSSRALAALALLFVATAPWRPLKRPASRYALLAAVLAGTVFLHWLYLFHLPPEPEILFIAGQGLTPLKVYSEYAIIALNLATALALWRRMRQPLPFNAAALFGAVCAMAMSEFFFTLYADTTDLFNLFGHIYKLISCLFIYRAIFVTTFESPYRQLYASQGRLQATLDAIPDLLFEVGPDGRIIHYHAPRGDLLDVPPDLFPNRTFNEALSPESAAICEAALREATEKGWSTHREFSIQLAQGEYWFELSVTLKPQGDQEEQHFIALAHDITERKRFKRQLAEQQAHLEVLVTQRTAELSKALQAAQIADQTKDVFLANITHELRTPLSAVIGFSNLARPLSDDPRQREYLDKVNRAGKTLSGIIDDLLDLSKIAAGRMDLETRPFSLRRLVKHCNSVLSFKAAEKGIGLIEKIDENIPDILLGDTLRLEQILLNLLSNAVKFTARGQVEIRVTLLCAEEQRVHLRIEVQDTGIGLHDEEIPLLFKPFSQADTSVTRRFGGSGLGLAICKHLTELMGGGIDVISQPGIGTTFRLKLWLKRGNPGEVPDKVADETAPTPIQYHEARVLVVDDQAFNRDIVKGLLGVVGISPLQAENGGEALAILSSDDASFDLVLMDIQMPVMDGLSATRAIRRLAGRSALPIVAMTAHTMTHEIEQSIAAGMNDHIGKPFDEPTFYRMLAKWIPRDKQTREKARPAPPPATSSLPPLRGIDTRAGLALLLGNEANYRQRLLDFVIDAPIAVAKIRQALLAQDRETASLGAHTLRGRAGFLGMNSLQTIAAELEAAIERDEAADVQWTCQENMKRLEKETSTLCAEICQTPGFAPENSRAASS